MEQFNKVISFVLGLVVVVIFLAVATGKINLKGTPFLSKGATNIKITPSPTPKQNKFVLNQTPTTKNVSSIKANNPDYHTYNGAPVSSIPSTGPELLLPLAASSLIGGLFLKGKGKK